MSDKAKQLIAGALFLTVCFALLAWNDAQVRRDGGRYGPDGIWRSYGER
uniref:Uncharacterized protein n=1 Tax=Rhodopseudomonas palustris (strain DX-1) TaxID=652103 RepID=E6VH77_RHOPX